jgi:uncharacterized protein (TIGR00369 family)
MNEAHHRKLERMYHNNDRTNAYYRPTLVVADGAATLTMQVREEMLHAARAVHGSIYFKALDDAAWFAVASRIEDVFVLTASFNIHLVRPVSEGTMRATGRLVHGSGRLHLAESELFDDEGRLLARGSGSFMRSKVALAPELGYA